MTNEHKMVDGKKVFLTDQEQEELYARRLRDVKDKEDVKYTEERKAEYPSIGDQLDAILKQLVFLSKKIGMDEDFKDITDKWKDTKKKHPKKVKR